MSAVETKTPEEWQALIEEIDREKTARLALLGEKEAERSQWALAVRSGDPAASKRYHQLGDEIQGLITGNTIGDDARTHAARELKKAERAIEDARVAAVLVERNRVAAERDVLRQRLAANVAEDEAVVRELDRNANEYYSLSADIDLDGEGASYIHETQRTTSAFLLWRMSEAGLVEVPRPGGKMRAEMRQMFGIQDEWITPVKGEPAQEEFLDPALLLVEGEK